MGIVMKNKIKKFVIILLAGGEGKRFNNKISKQTIKINNITILEHNIISFLKTIFEPDIQIVTNKDNFQLVSEITEKYNFSPPVLGGEDRQSSVYNGLKAIKKINPHYVLIHDSARPLLSPVVIKQMIEYTKKNYNCVIPVLPITDSVRILKDGKVKEIVDRNNKVLVQTPQLCNYNVLLEAHEKSTCKYEDESALLMSQSYDINIVKGNPITLKLTYKDDLSLLEPHLFNKHKYITKVGNGFDIHRFDIISQSVTKFIFLGGIKIKSTKSLIGHSDADVLLHAITDSLLSIINKGDIGTLFPPTDEKWKNADSSLFLRHASIMLKEIGGKINNIDATVICEQPKIIDYSKEIKENIANILSINPQKISIKGKTSESIGFIGRQEGIAAMAVTSAQVMDETCND